MKSKTLPLSIAVVCATVAFETYAARPILPPIPGISDAITDIQNSLTAGPNQLVVTHVEFDTTMSLATIHGRNLSGGTPTPPTVELAEMPQVILSYSDSQIVVSLTPGLLDGAYLLNVSTGPNVDQNDAFEVTLGEVGPMGPRGEKGDTGDKGDKGDTGIQGVQGEKGDKGDKGDKGETGLQGLRGEKGDKGDQGSKGDKGDPGSSGGIGPFTLGENVQFWIPDVVSAPNHNPVTAYEVMIPRGGDMRVEFNLYEVGRNLQWRAAHAAIYVNDAYVQQYSSGSQNNVIINHDLYGLNPGDRIKITVRVQNSAQSQYIDAYIKNFKLKADETALDFWRLK